MNTSGISFIIIGKNEECHLRRCIESIYKTIDMHALDAYEIIYVDSKSTDQSMDIAMSFSEVKCFCLSDVCNAAIARNVGAAEATKDVLLFVDADMELKPDFFEGILLADLKLRQPVISGWIGDVEQGALTDVRYKDSGLPFFAQETLDGGIFLIERKIWQLVGGMRTKYTTGEDGDLGLRLAASKVAFRRVPRLMTLHHTTSYHDPSRMWNMVWNKSVFYWRCVLYRDHLFNRDMYGLLWKNDKTLIMLSIAMVVGCFVPVLLLPLILVYFLTIGMRAKRQRSQGRTFEFFAYYFIVDVLNIVFFFSFFPKTNPVSYRAVSKQTQLIESL